MHARVFLVGMCLVTGCAAEPGSSGGEPPDGPGGQPDAPPGTHFRLPTPNARFDYQLGGSYMPPNGVQSVSRSRHSPPLPGGYSICYVNSFQINTEDAQWWLDNHPDLILRDSNGDPYVDPNWDEMLVDTSTPAKREAIAAIRDVAFAECAAAGFDAVEMDNLDSYTRSGGKLTADDAVAMLGLFSGKVHAHGLAAAQKNGAGLLPRKAELGTDFEITESCNRYNECDDYVAAYGVNVIVIEYRRADFDVGCQAFPQLSIVLRDPGLNTPSESGYVFDDC